MDYPLFRTKRPSTPRQRRLNMLVFIATGVGISASLLVPLFALSWLNIPPTNTQAEWAARIISGIGFALTLRWGFGMSHRIVHGEFDLPDPMAPQPLPTRTQDERVSSENANIRSAR